MIDERTDAIVGWHYCAWPRCHGHRPSWGLAKARPIYAPCILKSCTCIIIYHCLVEMLSWDSISICVLALAQETGPTAFRVGSSFGIALRHQTDSATSKTKESSTQSLKKPWQKFIPRRGTIKPRRETNFIFYPHKILWNPKTNSNCCGWKDASASFTLLYG